MKKLVFWIMAIFTFSGHAFDPEDYAGTYRETRNAYLKAANEFVLAYAQVQNLENLYKNSCYKVTGTDFTHLSGLHSGSCNEDGKASRTSVSLGDNLAALINVSPMTASIPNFKLDDTLILREAKNQDLYDAYEAAVSIKIEKDATCTSSKKYLSKASVESLAAIEAQYKVYYAAYIKSARALQVATAPYKSAWEAYKTVIAVYQAVSDCEGQMGTINHEDYDPYVP